MVIAVGLLRARQYREVFTDVQEVVKTAGEKVVVKVVLEYCLLSEEEKIWTCLLAKAAGADFVKTSTGFSHGGATEVDVALMRAVVGDDVGVKVAGGISWTCQYKFSPIVQICLSAAENLDDRGDGSHFLSFFQVQFWWQQGKRLSRISGDHL